MTLERAAVGTIDKKHKTHVGSLEIIDRYTDENGVEWRVLHVPHVSDTDPARETVRAKVAEWNRQLVDHPLWTAPSVAKGVNPNDRTLYPNNPVSEEIYSNPAMAEWRALLVPRAKALYPLQRPESTHLPSGGEIDEGTRDIFTNCLDAVGIWRRGKIMAEIAKSYIHPHAKTEMISIACGAAVPVLDSVKTGVDNSANVHLSLVDRDQDALDFAGVLAENQQLREGENFSLYNRDLVSDIVLSTKLVDELGEESADLVDALGITEYLDDEICAIFLKNCYKLVKPGGALVAANMLDSHPELDFNQRGIGWPKIFPRSPEKIMSIISAAGIPLENVVVTISEDGIYAVVEMVK